VSQNSHQSGIANNSGTGDSWQTPRKPLKPAPEKVSASGIGAIPTQKLLAQNTREMNYEVRNYTA